MYSGKSIIAVAILLACGTISVSARDCPKACTLELNEVCATNGKEYRLFGNPCMMDAFNCEHEFTWTRTMSLTPCLDDTTAVSADNINDCVTPCTMEYNPICGFDGLHYKIFSNPCEMRNAECDGKHYEAVALYNCVPHPAAFNKHCEVPCTREYNPVCGTNGEEFKTFSNPCILRNAHCKDNKVWKQVRTGACEQVQKINVNCEKPCTREYAPVCGTNGLKTEVFSNKCDLENAHCKDGKKWTETVFTDCIEFASVEDKKVNNCEKPCNKMYKPVCGTDGHQYKVFSNQCMMENQHCYDNHNWAVASFSLCEKPEPVKKECIKICPLIYAPVCGNDGQTYKVFDNKCLMEKEKECDGHDWKMINFGLCESPIPLAIAPERDECFKPCTREYAPICGTDGHNFKIFDNKCIMENQHCKDNHEWTQTTFGLCEKKVLVAEPKQNECPIACPLIYAPVCASNGYTHRMFDNECSLKAFNCQNSEHFVATFMAECEPVPADAIAVPQKDCPMICPLNYLPICAFNGKTQHTFANECELRSVNCQQNEHFIAQFVGECDVQIEELPKQDEHFACPANYDPQCGFDGVEYKVFANQCMMDGYNRIHVYNHIFLHVDLSFCSDQL